MQIRDLSTHSSIINQYLRELRDKSIQQDRLRFVTNVKRTGMLIGYEISKELDYHKATTQTVLGAAKTHELVTQPVLATVLRAGLPFHQGMLDVFDQADSAFITAYRRLGSDGAMQSVIEYVACPPLDGRPLIIADTMIATGTTLVDTYYELMKYGKPSVVYAASVLASKPAIEYIGRHIPDLVLFAAAIDDKLNDEFLIFPGLGDAGDLIYGEKSPRQ